MLMPLGNPLVVTMGMGQENLSEPGMLAAGISEYFIIVEAIRDALRGDGVDTLLDDGIDVYKIAAMLQAINNTPLSNPVYNKMTRLIYEKKIRIKADLDQKITRKSDPYRIVIGEHKVIREPNE